MRRCPVCGAALTRRDKERPAEFRTRVYCGLGCSVADRTRKAAERHAAEAAAPSADGLTFDRAAVLRVAHNAAPQIPVSLLADVVAAVEPLIAANARHRLLSPIAARIRAAR